MCCRCCSITQQKVWVFGFGSLLFIGGLVLAIWWPKWADEIVFGSLPLAPDSRTFDMWSVTPIPVYMYMYLFNWTNAADVRKPNVKPNFQQLGPYVFREEKTKEDLVWHPNNTVTFYGKRTWFFEPNLSDGSPDDLVTAPHLPSIAASSIMRNQPKVIKLFFNNALNSNGGVLYQTHTAIEWLFDGFYDEFLNYSMGINHPLAGKVESDHFAWLYQRNESKEFEGAFTIHTGKGDLRQMGDIKFWKGQNHTGFYEGDCGRLNGSTADLWVPNRATDEFITLFITDTCRIINLVPTNEKVTLEGVEGVKYETKPDTFDSGDLNPDMKCYCPTNRQPNNCPKSGVTDLGPCAEGAPMYLSHANFMYADPSYADTITGMHTSYERDAFYIIMEPKLGIPLQVNAAVQVSLLIRSDDDITILKGIPDFYAPVFITASKAQLNRDLGKQIQFVLNLPSLGRYIGIGMLSLGAILIILGIILTCGKCWYGQKRSMEDMGKSESAEH